MVYSIDELPDDIVSCIFSFLTIRDAFRARLSSPRWLHLPDSRSVVKLDSLNVFGKEIADQDKDNPAVQSKFVNIVNRFMRIWAGKRIHTLIIKFVLGKEHSSHIKRWIATSVRMEVEEIELSFSGRSQQTYVFQATLIRFENAPYLKRLCLKSCTLSPLYFRFTSWLSNLISLDLVNVPLHQRGLDFILSAGTNLISLELFRCDLPKYVWIDGQLLRLKKLIVYDALFGIELNCPSLEVFRYHGPPASMRFLHVPVLREAKFLSALQNGSCSLLFSHLTRQAPNLEALTLMIRTEVEPILSKSATCSLKKLVILASHGLDLLSVTNLLNASPLLETLQVQMWSDSMTSIEKRDYSDHSHYKLKEVRIVGFRNKCNGMELAMYLMKNAVALEKMFIAIPRGDCASEKVKSLQQLQEKINPTAKLYIRLRMTGVRKSLREGK